MTKIDSNFKQEQHKKFVEIVNIKEFDDLKITSNPRNYNLYDACFGTSEGELSVRKNSIVRQMSLISDRIT